jgi:hypothetical protein
MDRGAERVGVRHDAVDGCAASTAGILAAYERLISETGPDDAVLVYYSGHGGRVRDQDRAEGSAGWWQFIVPSDVAESVPGDVRLILTEELQILQLRLTGRTKNVTVVLDCVTPRGCRGDATALPKALDLAPDRTTLRARVRRCSPIRSRDRRGRLQTPTLFASWAAGWSRARSRCRRRSSGGRPHGLLRRRLSRS